MSPLYTSAEVSTHLVAVPDESTSDGAAGSYDRTSRTIELLKSAVDADEQTAEYLREEVVLLNIEVAESVALRYRGRGIPEEDLIQTACLGLVKAARGFDPDKSSNFLAFAVPTMRGEVKRYFRDHAWAIRPPRRIQELQPQVWAASSDFIRAHGRMPTNAQLAEVLGVDRDQVDEAVAAHKCFSPASFDQPTSSGADQEGLALIDTVGDLDDGFHRAEIAAVLRPLCGQLSARDRRIVYLRFVEEWTQSKIAEEFEVTQMQVSRLLSRILRQLRQGLTTAVGHAEEVGSDAVSA